MFLWESAQLSNPFLNSACFRSLAPKNQRVNETWRSNQKTASAWYQSCFCTSVMFNPSALPDEYVLHILTNVFLANVHFLFVWLDNGCRRKDLLVSVAVWSQQTFNVIRLHSNIHRVTSLVTSVHHDSAPDPAGSRGSCWSDFLFYSFCNYSESVTWVSFGCGTRWSSKNSHVTVCVVYDLRGDSFWTNCSLRNCLYADDVLFSVKGFPNLRDQKDVCQIRLIL